MKREDILKKMNKAIDSRSLRRTGFLIEEQRVYEAAILYAEMVSEKRGSIHRYLPSVEQCGYDRVVGHKNWKHFAAALDICDDLDISPQEWFRVQIIMVSRSKSPVSRKLGGVPSPQNLHGEVSLDRFGWFLDSSERATKPFDDSSYYEQRSQLEDVWEGPINLATRLGAFLDCGEYINIELIVLVVEALPGMFEKEYLVLHPLISEPLMESGPLSQVLKGTKVKIHSRGTRYKRELKNTYERSLKRVRELFPDYKEYIEWL